MENEVENNTPVVETEVSDNDFFDEVNDEVINETEESNVTETNEESDSSTPNETEEPKAEDTEVDYKPLLEALSKKVKYNGEAVNIESIEDLGKKRKKNKLALKK